MRHCLRRAGSMLRRPGHHPRAGAASEGPPPRARGCSARLPLAPPGSRPRPWGPSARQEDEVPGHGVASLDLHAVPSSGEQW
jgi:hypothetical protein